MIAASSGNHEIELDSFDTKFASYTARYPNTGISGANNATQAYYSVEHSGVHTIFVTPYVDHTIGSAQYNWCAYSSL